ncbi:unnamed protein product [Nippostrongylus brasiliensis]|uniref:Secreted protein n=1 Tax=Nippostrongylus brasiliensis TaxID=27835 RepID=A0A0N4XGC0_NIPBR|nr:unnamed protein product [Nippostrongylus brasiliensis]
MKLLVLLAFIAPGWTNPIKDAVTGAVGTLTGGSNQATTDGTVNPAIYPPTVTPNPIYPPPPGPAPPFWPGPMPNGPVFPMGPPVWGYPYPPPMLGPGFPWMPPPHGGMPPYGGFPHGPGFPFGPGSPRWPRTNGAEANGDRKPMDIVGDVLAGVAAAGGWM